MPILAFLIPVAFAAITASVDSHRGGSRSLWSVLGFFFGPLALIVALLTLGRKCPVCSSTIPTAVSTCPSCQADLRTVAER